MREQQGFGRHANRLFHGRLGGVGDVDDDAEAVARANDVRTERRQSVVSHRAGLKVADVVRRVVHELHRAHAATVRFLQTLELLLQEVESLDVDDDRRLAGRVCGTQIADGQRAAHAMLADELVYPVETIEVVGIEESGLRRAERDEHVLRVPTEDGTVRHIGKTQNGDVAGVHLPPELGARARGARCDSVGTAVGVNVDRDVLAQQRGGAGKRILGDARLRARARAAGEHRTERAAHGRPHPVATADRVTAALHDLPPVHFRTATPRKSMCSSVSGVKPVTRALCA